MEKGIVERLRDRAYSSKAPDPLLEAAAAEIESLRAAVRAQPTRDSDSLVRELRDMAAWHGGRDIASRVAYAMELQSKQRIGLERAADEVERLRAIVKRLGGEHEQADPPQG